MPRFFVEKEQIQNGVVTITGEDAHHLSRALRMAAGEHITVCDCMGTDYDCILTEFLPDRVLARVDRESVTQTEPPYTALLYQGLPKGEKFDLIIQKSVECGVCRIVPFESERSIVRIREEKGEKKAERQNRIAVEAAKQCGRGILPVVASARTFQSILSEASRVDLALFCYEGEGTIPLPVVLRRNRPMLPQKPTIAILIGSEGGFSEAEAAAAKENGWIPVGLGKRILRTETAPVVALSMLCAELELT
ncbi:MAG: 16S rRNA (uracil(1498)-N(3))-methyltransferase [Ruminococcaceae bacterium]|nr:16S rRNA (uracil(1498)-N(3))-methyltransferase [Oscillospiraceae bacterium]